MNVLLLLIQKLLKLHIILRGLCCPSPPLFKNLFFCGYCSVTPAVCPHVVGDKRAMNQSDPSHWLLCSTEDVSWVGGSLLWLRQSCEHTHLQKIGVISEDHSEWGLSDQTSAQCVCGQSNISAFVCRTFVWRGAPHFIQYTLLTCLKFYITSMSLFSLLMTRGRP